MFYTLKRVPIRKVQFREDIEQDLFLQCFFEDEIQEAEKSYDTKNTEYWAGDTNFTKYKGQIKYSDSLEKIRRARNYNMNHNSLEGSYIGIIELFKDENGRITFGEDKV
jgi:hypothetical protein